MTPRMSRLDAAIATRKRGWACTHVTCICHEYPDSKRTLDQHVSLVIRSEAGRRGISGNRLAEVLGRSQNYTAMRLRGEAAFSVEDLVVLIRLFHGLTFKHLVGGAV